MEAEGLTQQKEVSPAVPRVSVIVPCYNDAVSVRRCLDSVLGQTLKPFEVIVVNDGSTDESAQIVQSHAGVTKYLEQENGGAGAARNAGIAAATGDYIAFLDADDFWLEGFLERCVMWLESHPEAIAVSAGQRIRSWSQREGVNPSLLADAEVGSSLMPSVLEDFFGFWAQYDHVRTGSAVIRRSVIEQAGGQLPDLRMSQDLEYWGYLATFGKWGFIPEILFVSDGTRAASQGWLKKYRLRWECCPKMDQWQRRILPRLPADSMRAFQIFRGKLARSFVHSKILAANDSEARQIIREFGEDFPGGWISKFMRIGSKSGPLGWWLFCRFLRAREMIKDIVIDLLQDSMARPSEARKGEQGAAKNGQPPPTGTA
jgi:glycosyltransferase involved in cell wall biosynthesis